MLRIPLTEHLINEEVLRKVRIKWKLLLTVRKRLNIFERQNKRRSGEFDIYRGRTELKTSREKIVCKLVKVV